MYVLDSALHAYIPIIIISLWTGNAFEVYCHTLGCGCGSTDSTEDYNARRPRFDLFNSRIWIKIYYYYYLPSQQQQWQPMVYLIITIYFAGFAHQ